MGKRKYKATKIQDISHTKLGNELEAGRVVVAIDVAKTKFYAAIVDSSGKRRQIVKWEHPAESREFLALIEQLGGLGHAVEVVMEPTGVYGDAIRASTTRLRSTTGCRACTTPRRRRSSPNSISTDSVSHGRSSPSAGVVWPLR
jgi:transposase